MRHLLDHIARVSPWVDPDDPAAQASAAKDLTGRQAAADAAAEALLSVRTYPCRPMRTMDDLFPRRAATVPQGFKCRHAPLVITADIVLPRRLCHDVRA